MRSKCAKIMRSRIFNIALLCLFVLCAGIYNYGLHRSFWPDHEYAIAVYGRFLNEFYGHNMDLTGIYYNVAYIPYKLFGCSLKAVRVFAVLMYQIIIFFSTIVAIYSYKRRRFEWYKLGIFAFIAVLLHPGSSLFCGSYYTNLHQYPYDMHTSAVAYATLSIMLLCIHQGITERKYKNIMKVIILIVIVMGYKRSDFLYIIGFVGPLICVGLMYLWREKRKLFFVVSFGVIAALALLHVISFAVPALSSLFEHHSLYTGYEAGEVYGNIGFADLGEIFNYIANTTTELLALFNIDISAKSMLSISTLLAGLRLILVIFIITGSFRIVANAIRKANYDQSLDSINIVLALGILFNLFIVMFSRYGTGGYCIRYMTLILFYGAILLARQSENIIVKLYGEINDRSKLYFFLFFSLAIVANMTTFWKMDDYVADYETAIKNVSDYIIENNLGNGIGTPDCASLLTLAGEGSYAVVNCIMAGEDIQYQFRELDEVVTTFHYVVDWTEGGSGFNEGVVYRYFGAPDEIIERAGFVIYYYREGFSSQWEQAQ